METWAEMFGVNEEEGLGDSTDKGGFRQGGSADCQTSA